MATDFYKVGGSYYTANTNQKILNLDQLRQYAIAGGKEISPPSGPQRSGGDILIPNERSSATLATVASPNQSGLDQWKSGANLVEAARSIIQMKQGFNKDIQTAKQVWGEKARDTSAWGKDQQIFTGMSPADQASIRSKQYAVAETHLSGLADEEKYRATRTEDTLKYISDIYKDKIQELKDQKADANEKERISIAKRQTDLEAERNRILNLKDKMDMGVDVTATDLYGSNVSSDFQRIGFKEGGSLSWRTNNAGNIKFGDFARKYGAIQGPKASDGGYYAIFPDEETGRQAMKDLLKSPNYQKLSLEDAMKRWSNSGYGSEVYTGQKISIPMSKMTDVELNKLIDNMTKREGYKIGKDTSTSTGNQKDLAYLSSLTGTSTDDLKGLKMSPDELKLFISIAESNKKKEAGQGLEVEQHKTLFDQADKQIQEEKAKQTEPNLIYGLIVRQYSPSLTTEEMKTIMTQNGYTWDSFLNKWK